MHKLTATLPPAIELVEVGARDGLQNERTKITTADKVELIRRAVAAGSRRIEVASFVSRSRVPQMADAEEVCARLEGLEAIRIGLALNQRGAERAMATCIDEIGTVVSASDGFGLANQGMRAEETLAEALAIFALARGSRVRVQATISVAFGCPFDGVVDVQRVVEFALALFAAGAVDVALADTIGAAGPAQVRHVLAQVREAAPNVPLRLHFHDTRNMGVANAFAALECGASAIDASIAGLGGCPFAPGATGNVATEDLVYMLDNARIEHGIDIGCAIETARWINQRIGRTEQSKLARVGPFVGN